MNEIKTKDVWPEAMQQVIDLKYRRIPRRTSVEAYNKIRESGLLSQRRFEVYDALYRWGPATATELAGMSGIKGAWKRLSELVRLGVAYEVRTRKCQVTGQQVIEFDVTDNMPVKPAKKISERQAMIQRIIELERENADLRGMI